MRQTGGTGGEQWTRYWIEVRRGGRPVYGKNARRWRERCEANEHGEICGRRRRGATGEDTGDMDEHGGQRANKRRGMPRSNITSAMGERMRRETQTCARGRKRRMAKDVEDEIESEMGKRRRVESGVLTAQQLERLRTGLGEPFGDG